MRKDFDGRPLHLGSVTGIRSFAVGERGGVPKLFGPVYTEIPFEPGENVAVCNKNQFRPNRLHRPTPPRDLGRKVVSLSFTGEMTEPNIVGEGPRAPRRQMPENADLGMRRMLEHMQKFLPPEAIKSHAESLGIGLQVEYSAPVPWTPPPVSLVKDKWQLQRKKGHQVAQLDCTCGYYAYCDTENNPHYGGQHVLGIVEGYGVVTVGDRGFRASKARLVALIGVLSDDPVAEQMAAEFMRIVGMKSKPKMFNLSRELIDRYQVPLFPTAETAVGEYPLSDLAAMTDQGEED